MLKTILVVDDSALDRTVLRGFLKKDYTVIEAASGTEMIAELRRHERKISAILLDLSMSDMNGFDALHKIRENALYRRLPVIVMSEQCDEETQAQALALGAVGFAAKPFNRDILLPLIGNIISLRDTSAFRNSISIDPLTGIPTRAEFYLQAAQRIKKKEAGYYVLTCFDIENFKVINDQYGLDIGDKILREIAKQISKTMVFLGGICCHDAADRFATLYPASRVHSDNIEQLHKAVESINVIDHSIKIRVGRYFVTDLDLPINAMYDRATIAEESIKGRYDIYIAEYTEEMRQNLVNEQQIVNDMGRALEAGEFEPWFQPQYNHATGALIGAEALVRWRKNDKIVLPNDFIPVFERNGFIYVLDQYIWRSVCALQRRWLDAGKNPLPVSVNVSRYDLFQKDFFDKICSLTEEYQIPSDLLRLEVTESAFSESTKVICNTVKKLIRKGFTVEIDDFGSGYSSLNTLKDVPASILKLDMRFFESTGDAKRAGNIVESVVRMAKWLGMAVIAEGVKDKPQADYLKSIGCYYIQGYLYAKPMSGKEYEKRLDSGAKEAQLTRLQTLQNLDNNDFWDSHSMDTLIFNSYVGAACILECNNGKIEVIRATDMYMTMFGSSSMHVGDVLKLSLEGYLDADNINRFNNAIKKSIELKRTVSDEFVFTGVPGCPEKMYVIAGLRVIATASDRMLVYCLNNNITEQRIAEQERLESIRKLEIIMNNVNGGVSAVMVHDDGTSEVVFNNEKYYELYGYTKEQAQAQNIDVMHLILPEDIDSVMEKVKKLKRDKQPVIIDYSIKRQDGSRALLRANASLMSFPGYGDDVITSVITDITEKRSLEEHLRAVVSNIYGAVSATYIDKDGQPQFIVVNDQFFNMLGYRTREEYELEHPNKYTGLHPDDRKRIIHQFETADGGKKQYTMNYRVVRKDGTIRYIRNNISVINMFGIDSPVQLSVANDITEQRNAELMQRDLLDNLPFGAAMYEFDGKGLKALHINKQYQIMAGRNCSNENLEGFSPIDFIHPNDRAVALNAIKDAIANNQDAGCNIRILCGEDEYRSYHIDARILAQPDGKYLAYVAYTRLSEQELTFENALPHMFSTIMESSTDLAFAKDINFRYICCSRTFATLLGLENENEVVGKTDYELFPKEIADMFRKDDTSLFATKKPQIDIQEILPSPDGTKHYIRTSKHLMRSDTDSIIGIYCVGRDVTEVREAYARLRLLTDSIPGGIATFRCSPGKVEALYYNDGVCEIFGYTREEYDANPRILDAVFKEDRPVIRKQIKLMQSGKKHLNFTVRVHTNNGGYKWINGITTVTDNVGDVYIINAVLTDVTEQQEEKESLRLAEEEYRIATEHSARTICRYNIADMSLKITHEAANRFALNPVIQGVPYAQVRGGLISPDTADNYIAFYKRILQGEKVSACVFRIRLNNKWHWLSARSTSIFDLSEKPVSAIISFTDITEAQEKELMYKKWKQSLTVKKPEQFTLYRCNLNKNVFYDTKEGSLFGFAVENQEEKQFDKCTSEFCNQYIVADDQSKYIEFMDSDRLVASYHRGFRIDGLIFRARISEADIRWIRLSLELLEYPGSTDVEAYLMYEDINDSVLEELHIKKQAETDPLTGLQNRKIFIKRVNELIAQNKKDSYRALFLLDIDYFKHINDIFGHGVGDESIVSMAEVILSVIREDGLVCRLGGDEFLIYLPDMPSCEAVADKARELCEAAHITIKNHVQVSASIGVALVTEEGENFDSVYHKADEALYHVKGHGKNNYAFYDADMERDDNEVISDAIGGSLTPLANGKNTILVVDDSSINRMVHSHIFKNEFTIAEAENGQVALDYLREHSDEVAIVLLDIMMPVMDGYQLLEAMRADLALEEIPVIVISGEDDRKASLRAIKAGASDYVLKPVNAELLRLRVCSALSKVENRRLHEQNDDYAIDSQELHSYRFLMDRSSTVLIEYNTKIGTFKYAPKTGMYLNGTFDDRPIWQVFAEDQIACDADIEAIHKMISEAGKPRQATFYLMTPDGTTHPFLMSVMKCDATENDEMVLITLTDRKWGGELAAAHRAFSVQIIT